MVRREDGRAAPDRELSWGVDEEMEEEATVSMQEIFVRKKKLGTSFLKVILQNTIRKNVIKKNPKVGFSLKELQSYDI